MLIIRKSNERGTSITPWLDSRHSFSFADYYDPQFMGFSSLRVINDDKIKPAKGFGLHPHKNMEIITYVVEGALKHQDSLGTGSIIKPGEIQRMSAGSGIQHSEFNASTTDPLHLFQIWILPDQMELQPAYEQKTIKREDNQLILIGSNRPSPDAITIHQNVHLYVAYLQAGKSLSYFFKEGRRGWLQLIKGEIGVSGLMLFAGDGFGIQEEKAFEINAVKEAEFLFFDLD